MNYENFLSILAIAVLLTLPALAKDDEVGRWTQLGDLHVSDSLDKDTLRVGADEGAFTAIQLRVKVRKVQFHDLEIHFENGDVQDVSLRSVIKPGRRSRVIDLPGGQRAIDKIVFLYDAQTRRRHKGARVEVWGRR